MIFTKNYSRALRPKNFSDFTGQNNAIQILNTSVKNDLMFSTYLFAGQYGAGKTSLARVFCKTINCLNITFQNSLKICCSECINCISIFNDNNIDYIEIDAASNKSIDNIRNLIENTKFSPIYLKYKFIVIDEAHCLSADSFKTMLKTLEESSEKVIIILVTTNPELISEIVISRCQIIYFNEISENTIFEYLLKVYNMFINDKTLNKSIFDEIKIKKLIESIALYSNKSLRSALNIFELSMNMYVYGNIDITNIYKYINVIEKDKVYEIINSICNNINITNCLEILNKDTNNYKNKITWNIIINIMIENLKQDLNNINNYIFNIISLIQNEYNKFDEMNYYVINSIIINRIAQYYNNIKK